LALCFDTQVSAHFMKGHFDLPAAHKPLDDLLWRNRQIGTKQGLGLEDLFWIAEDDPTDGQRWKTAVVPDGGVGGDLDHSFFLTIPLLDRETLPASVLVLRHGFQGGQALAFLAWAAHFPGCLF